MREALVSIDDADFDALGINELVELSRSAGIHDFEELVCHGTGSVIQIEVGERLDEDRLESLGYVDEWEYVPTAEDAHLYLIAFTAPALSAGITEPMDDLVGTCDPEISAREATLSLVGPQDAIAGTISEYQDGGVSPSLRRLGGYRGRERPLDRLTDRQREVIQTAFDMGYYEVPRNVSTEDISAELDLDSSTVAEHLQRAERNLLTVLLSSE
jgi:DNA-binding CsgD family transcriptional regulator